MIINYEQVDNVIRDIIFTINALKAANNQLESEISRLSNCNGTEENSHDHSSQIRRMKEIININTKMIQQLEIICNGLSNFKSDVFKKDIDLSRLFENNDLLEKIMQRVIPSYECSCEDEQVLTDKETTNGEELVEGMENKYNINLADGKMDCIRCQSTDDNVSRYTGEYNGWNGCISTSLAGMLRINNGVSADVPANKIIISKSDGSFPEKTSQEYSDFSFETYANLEQGDALRIIKEQLYDNKVCVVKLDNGSGENDGHTVVCSGIRDGISLGDATWDDLLFNDVGRTREEDRKGKVMAEMSYQSLSGRKVEYSVPKGQTCCVRIDTSK